LPDNHYRIYLIRTETQTERLVLDVVVRDHRPVDPGDVSDGTRDRPPTDDAPEPVDPVPVENAPEASHEAPAAAGNEVAELVPAEALQPSSSTVPTSGAAAVSAAAMVLSPKTDWAVRLDQAFARADRRRWQVLRRRRPR
jgi:hypothetical protein